VSNCIEGDGRHGVKISHNERHKKQFRKDVYGVRLKKVLAIIALDKQNSPKCLDLRTGR
jgi:hypothetical protein